MEIVGFGKISTIILIKKSLGLCIYFQPGHLHDTSCDVYCRKLIPLLNFFKGLL